MTPIEAFLSIADGTAGPETLRWFRERITAYLTDRNRPTLEKAFNLSSAGPGKPSDRTRFMKRLRDSSIRDAFKLFDHDMKVMVRCEQLAAEIRRFEGIIWPRWKDLEEPPADCSELRRLLYQAKRTGEPLPTSRQGVYQAVFQGKEIIKTPHFLF